MQSDILVCMTTMMVIRAGAGGHGHLCLRFSAWVDSSESPTLTPQREMLVLGVQTLARELSEAMSKVSQPLLKSQYRTSLGNTGTPSLYKKN